MLLWSLSMNGKYIFVKGMVSSCRGGLGSMSSSAYELIIEILRKYSLLQFWSWWPNQVTILHMSQQLSCCDMRKIVTWSDQYLLSKSNMYFYEIWVVSSKTHCEMGPWTNMATRGWSFSQILFLQRQCLYFEANINNRQQAIPLLKTDIALTHYAAYGADSCCRDYHVTPSLRGKPMQLIWQSYTCSHLEIGYL